MIRIGQDDITPDLRRKITAMRNPEAAWRAMAQQVISVAKRSFREPALRIEPWAPKKNGQPSNLIKKGLLLSSLRIVSAEKKGAVVGSDRPYATIHQLGGTTRPMPRRPFLPFTRQGELHPQHVERLKVFVERAVNVLLREG